MVFGILFCASSSLMLPLLAFGARAVVAEDVDDDRVVADAEAVQLVDHLADLGVDVLDEAGEDLHQPQLERTLRLRDAVPRGHASRPAA